MLIKTPERGPLEIDVAALLARPDLRSPPASCKRCGRSKYGRTKKRPANIQAVEVRAVVISG